MYIYCLTMTYQVQTKFIKFIALCCIEMELWKFKFCFKTTFED